MSAPVVTQRRVVVEKVLGKPGHVSLPQIMVLLGSKVLCLEAYV